MSNVTLSIGGRAYTVACAPGEETHIQELGRLVDARLQDMSNLAGQSEARTLLFATLLLADELHDRDNGAAAERPPSPSASLAVAENLEALANRLEAVASQLEEEG